MPTDKTKIPKWWKPAPRFASTLYLVEGETSWGTKKTLHIVAKDEGEAGKVARDQFSMEIVERVSIHMGVVWAPRPS